MHESLVAGLAAMWVAANQMIMRVAANQMIMRVAANQMITRVAANQMIMRVAANQMIMRVAVWLVVNPALRSPWSSLHACSLLLCLDRVANSVDQSADPLCFCGPSTCFFI